MVSFKPSFFSKSSSRDQTLADTPPVTVKKESTTEVPATADPQEEIDKHPRVAAANATKDRLSEEARDAWKAMTHIEDDFDKFSGILLGIQKAGRSHTAELQQMDEGIQSQQGVLHRLTDQIGSTDDDEMNCKAIDEANAKIRELKATEKKVRAMLEQSRIDREDLEGRLSTLQAEVNRVMAQVQDSVQGQPEQKRHNPGLGKRDIFGTLKKTTGMTRAVDPFPSFALPANPDDPSNGGRVIAPGRLRVSMPNKNNNEVPSSSHSSSDSLMNNFDDIDSD